MKSKLSPDIKHSLALSPCLQNVTLCKSSVILSIEDKLNTHGPSPRAVYTVGISGPSQHNQTRLRIQVTHVEVGVT